jgi:competence protein ComEC
LDKNIGGQVMFTGYVCSESAGKINSQRFCFDPHESDDRILIVADKFPTYIYGDILHISGTIKFPENFETYEGGPLFDYVSYLSKDGIRYVMQKPEIVKSGEDEGNIIIATLYRIKRLFVHKMETLLAEPGSSLLGGLLLGDRQSIPKELTEEFKRAGLVHILVLSGYNVTIVAESFMKCFSFLPRVFGRSLGALSIVLFALMTGGGATTVRASIMAIVVILSKSLSRKYDAGRALVFAGFIMVMQKPLILAFDLSFELSFLATLSIIYVTPLVAERMVFIPEKWNMREIFSTTIATQIFVAPFILFAMGELSLIAFVSNIFVLPVIPYTMLFGFLGIAFGFVTSYIAYPLSWITALLLAYILKAVTFFSHMPFASIKIHASIFVLACIYVFYIVVLIILHKRRNSSPRFPN